MNSVYGPENFTSNVVIEKNINKDTLINGNLYYSLNYQSANRWFRFDNSSKVVYINDAGVDYVYMNFSLNSGEQFQHIFFDPNPYYIFADVIEGNYKSGDSLLYYKGFSYLISYGFDAILDSTKFVKGIGLISEKSYHLGSHGSLHKTDLTQTKIIIDSTQKYFKQFYSPEIIYLPNSVIHTNIFDAEVTVNHYFSRLNYTIPGGYGEGVDFIDSVFIISYYSREDSNIINPIYFGVRIPVSYDYRLYFELDTALMKQNFIFNYKINAVDKFWIPNSTYLPDYGYYSLRWDTTLTNYDNDLPTDLNFSLSQNYPNPFNPTTKIKFTIAAPLNLLQGETFVTMKVYDILGTEVAILVNEKLPTGEYEIEFDGTNLPSGIYFYQLRAGSYKQTKKMVLAK